MPNSAARTVYREEYIAQFEKRETLARQAVTTEIDVNGKSAVFLVGGSGGAYPTKRTAEGDIPTRPEDLNQFTINLVEWNDVPVRSNFNIFTSQGNGTKMMQQSSIGVMNRQIDRDIHTALSTATESIALGAGFSDPSPITKALTKLGNAFALEEEPFAFITPAFFGLIMGLPQATSMDYVKLPRFDNVPKSRAFNWYGVNWIVDAGLPGAGQDGCASYIFAKQAVGHACDKASIETVLGYEEKDNRSYVRTTAYMGSLKLQNSGIIKLTLDELALS